MKVKTSITLSPQTIDEIDEIAGADKNRSRLIEQAILEFIERHRRGRREARDAKSEDHIFFDLAYDLESNVVDKG